jgi:ABC-type transport system substrate-binding protein
MTTNHNAPDPTNINQFSLNTSRRAVVVAGAAGMATALLPAPTMLAAQDGDASPSDQILSLPLYPYGELVFLDPHRATNWGHHWVLLPQVWAGLLRLDEHGAVMNDLASSIESEDDGLVWVATIRSDVTFASGNPVTAEAMIQGWRRALNAQQLAPMAGYMSRVEGFDAFIVGDSEEIGFEARDNSTVAIRLSEPYAHFPEDLATFVWAAVDTVALDGVPGSEAPFADASAGLWRFAISEDDTLVRMIPNPNAPDALPNGFGEVQWRVIDGAQAAETAFSAFQNGELAIADVTRDVSAAVQQDQALADQIQTIPSSGSTMLIGMDFAQAPFDDVRVRRAVAASIDRSVWATEITAGEFTEATSITPPVLMESANYAAPDPLGFDPDLARSLIAEAGIDETNQPVIAYYLTAGASNIQREQATALLDMINANSGLVIELDDTLTTEQIEALRGDNGGLQFDLRWWWPLTNSPSGLVSLAASDSASMSGWFNWSADLENADASAAAETFAALAADIVLTMDATERAQMYAEAEQILVDNAVFVPLGHWVQTYAQSSALTGTRQGAYTGYAPLVLDSDVVYQPTS